MKEDRCSQRGQRELQGAGGGLACRGESWRVVLGGRQDRKR